MELKTFPVGMLQSNIYLFYDLASKEAVCFDAGDEANKVLDFLKQKELQLKYIILTHGHCDHIGAAEALRDATGAKIIIHKEDIEMISDVKINMADTFGLGKVEFREDIAIEDGYSLDVLGKTMKFIHTPGHTKGSVCVEYGKYLITGDTLFKQSIGRTDFYGGSMKQMFFSLQKLGKLEPNLIVLPGHGEASTIKEELRTNMYMVQACMDK